MGVDRNKASSPLLRVGSHLVSTGVNGPGKRLVIWLQGCPLHCKGCFNPEFWDEGGGVPIHPAVLLSFIDQSDGIEGVTFSGGEPLHQAKGLLPFAEACRSRQLSLVLYTGYTLEDICNGKIPYAEELLRYVDILIDGRYKEEEKAPLLWRGSRNQRVFFLTDRYQHLAPFVALEGRRAVEIQVAKDALTMTGIFDLELWERLKKTINS